MSSLPVLSSVEGSKHVSEFFGDLLELLTLITFHRYAIQWRSRPYGGRIIAGYLMEYGDKNIAGINSWQRSPRSFRDFSALQYPPY
jgi:hypothetical protein